MGSTNNSSQELTKRPQKPEVEHQADSSSPEPGLTEGYFDTGNQRTGFPDEIPDSQEELGSEHQGSSSFFSETQEEPARDSLDASSSKALDETNSFIGNRHKDWQQDQVSSVENPPLQQAHPFGTHGKGEPATHNFQTQATEIIEGGTRLTPRASPKFILNQSGINVNGPVEFEHSDDAGSTDMDEEATQPSTQPVFDPRRQGLNNSGLNDRDRTDILCILHPNSTAALAVVAEASRCSPQHVLQNEGLSASFDEAEDGAFDGKEVQHSRDLALRMSSKLRDPAMGFCFGRNKARCDIIIGSKEEIKRFSNMHFRIFINSGGILMLEDTSTNGTVVDGVLLGGKRPEGLKTRMISASSIIQLVTSNAEEEIKFLVRFPPRHGLDKDYERKLKDYIAFVAQAGRKARAVAHAKAQGQFIDLPGGETNPFDGPLFQEAPSPALFTPSGQHLTAGTSPHNSAGMHWDGGEHFNVVRVVGKGAFATVYLLAGKNNGNSIAAKELEKRRFMKHGILDFKVDNEIKIMKHLKHPNIVQYLDCVEQLDHIYILMEYVPCGDLATFMHKEGAMPEFIAKQMSHQVLRALVYLHKQKITHRDIKPDNILVSSESPFHIKLSDFGLSKVIEDPQTFLKTFCGTLLYCAPEVFPGYNLYSTSQTPSRRRASNHSSVKNDPYNSSVDLWSYAVCLYQALCGKPPFMGDASDKGQGMLRTIMTTKLDLGPLVQCGVSKAGIDFVVGMLKVEPGLRRSELKCVQHEWLQGIAEENDEMQIEEEEQELAAIAEEEDGDDALDASQLSIHEAPNREIGDSEDEEVSEVEEINMEAGFAQYGQPGPSEIADVSYPSLPQVNESVTQQFNTHQPAPNRLFGEIGLSALESSGALGQNAPFALAMPFGSTEGSSGSSSDPDHGFGDDSLASASHNGNDVRAAPQYLHQPHGANHAFDQPGAPSLLGAESLVGQLNMASTPTTTSATSRPKDAATGHTLGHTQTFSVSGSKRLVDPEDTIDVDKASKRPRIEPCSETTKTTDEVEEMGSSKATSSSNIGGNDSFSRAKSAVALTASQANKIALEKTFDESAVSHGNSPNKENIDATTSTSLLAGTGEQEMSTGGAKGQNPEAPRNQAFSINATEQGKSADATQSSNFVRPQALMGQVTTLPGSIYDITLDINHRVTTWGRDPPNGPGMHAIVFPQPNDTRIPKYALAILFHCPGMRDAPETNTQWKKWKGTQPVIFTQSRQHIYVNGVKLRSTSPEGWPFGKLYTEDIITIWDDDKKKEFLKFRCTFYHGLSAVPRPKTGPKFVVETSDIGFEKEKAKTQEQSQGQATTGSVTQPMAPSTSTTT